MTERSFSWPGLATALGAKAGWSGRCHSSIIATDRPAGWIRRVDFTGPPGRSATVFRFALALSAPAGYGFRVVNFSTRLPLIPPMSTPDLPPSPAPAPTPVPAKKSNTVVIVLCVVLGVFLLVLASCVGTCIYVGKKAKEYGKESQKSPQIAALALAAAIAPDVEVVSKDMDAGTISIRNKKTGEVMNFDAKNLSTKNISSVIEKMSQGKGVNVEMPHSPDAAAGTALADRSSEEASVSAAQTKALDATVKEFGSGFPIYAGGDAKTTGASQNIFGGITSSEYSFVTGDAPAKVAAYYKETLSADGYSIVTSENGSDENGPRISQVYQKGGMGTTLNLTVQVENGKTHGTVNQVLLKNDDGK